MPATISRQFEDSLAGLDAGDPQHVSRVVDAITAGAAAAGASDVHLVPSPNGLEMLWRIDGVLQPVWRFAVGVTPNIVARLKVLAGLLTYRNDAPQEGRIRAEHPGAPQVEMRVSTFPTLHGEKAVVRLFAGSDRFRYLDDLGLPDDIHAAMRRLLGETGGVVLVSGPAGSGKTTTLYASLRELVDRSSETKAICTLEDPIEVVIDGVAQSQIRPAAGFDYETGLRSLMRQDPQVIMVGEIRDRTTAEIVFQASLTGHLVLTTFHAGSAAEAIGRLLDMGIEPYQLRSGILGVLNQRLVRRLCGCATPAENPEEMLGLADSLQLDSGGVRLPRGCPECHGTGYQDRMILAELLTPTTPEAGRAILAREDSRDIEQQAIHAGLITRWDRARTALAAGQTSPEEVRRVLGFRDNTTESGKQK